MRLLLRLMTLEILSDCETFPPRVFRPELRNLLVSLRRNPETCTKAALYGSGNQPYKGAAQRGNFAHQPRTQIGISPGRHHENRLQAGVELAVHPGHLEFVLVVADGAYAAQNSLSTAI